MAVDRGDIKFTLVADPSAVEKSFAELEQSAQASSAKVAGSISTVSTATTGMQGQLAALSRDMRQVFVDVGAGLSQSMNTAFEDTTTSAKVAGLAVTAAFAVVGLGAVYAVVKAISASVGFLTGLVTGSSYQNDGVEELRKASVEVENLRTQFNLTRQEAAAMGVMFQQTGVSANDYTGAVQKVLSASRNSVEEMTHLGIQVGRTGNDFEDFERIGLQALKVLESYAVGSDRAAAAASAGLPTYEALKAALTNNSTAFEQAKADAAKYSLFINDDGVAALKEYDDVMREFGVNMKLTWSGITRAVTDTVMPILTDLANFFKEGIPLAVSATRLAMGIASVAFHGFADGIYIVTESVLAAVQAAGSAIAGLGRAFVLVLKGDFAGAWAAVQEGGTNAKNRMGEAFDNMAARAETTMKRIRLAAEGGQEGDLSTRPDAGMPKRFKALAKKPDAEKDKPAAAQKLDAETSAMQTYEAALDQRRIAFAKENGLRQMSKQQESDYWADVLDTYQVGSKDRTAIALKMSHLELDILRATAKTKRELSALSAEDWRAETLDYVAELQARAEFEKEQGNITQAVLLTKRLAFNDMRLQAELEFIQKKIEIAKLDPENNLVLLEQLELSKLELKRKFNAQLAEINRQQFVNEAEPFKNIADTIGNAFNQVGVSLMTNWKGIGATLKGVLGSIGQSIIQETILKPLQAKIVAFAKERLLSLAGIGVNAAEAGSGAAASQASIPIVGPYLALAAMAAMFAAVSGMAGKVPSAMGGFDIPRGLNPMTQLHEQEMVLPAAYADVIRGLAETPGQASAPAVSQAAGQIRGMPPSEWLMVHRKDLVMALKSANRDFIFTGA